VKGSQELYLERGVMISRELDDGQLLTVDEVAEWLRLEKPYVYQLASI
jgi:hypothetical protein